MKTKTIWFIIMFLLTSFMISGCGTYRYTDQNGQEYFCRDYAGNKETKCTPIGSPPVEIFTATVKDTITPQPPTETLTPISTATSTSTATPLPSETPVPTVFSSQSGSASGSVGKAAVTGYEVIPPSACTGNFAGLCSYAPSDTYVLFVWMMPTDGRTPGEIGGMFGSEASGSYVTTADGEKIGLFTGGSDYADKLFVAFFVPAGSSGFQLHWNNGATIRLGK